MEYSKEDLMEAKKQVNGAIAAYAELIEKRLQSLYEPLGAEPLGLTEAIAAFNASSAETNKEIDDLNAAVRSRAALKRRLLNLNDQIARIDAKDSIKRYADTEKELETARRELTKAIENAASSKASAVPKRRKCP